MVRCINANTMNGQWMKDCLNDENYIETLTSNCFPVFFPPFDDSQLAVKASHRYKQFSSD